MAKKKAVTPVEPKTTLLGVPMAALPQDDEAQHDLESWILSVRDLQAFCNVALSTKMEAVWGGGFSQIKTGTDKATGRVYVYRGDEKDPNPVKVNRTGTQNALSFSFAKPLQKLAVRPAADRQWDLIAVEQPILDGPMAFVFEIAKRKSVPRNLKDETATGGPPGSGGTPGSGGATAASSRKASALDKSLSETASSAEDDEPEMSPEAVTARLAEIDRSFEESRRFREQLAAEQEARIAKWDAEAAAKKKDQ